MAKYYISCPKCGAMNPASTSFLQKRTISCAQCNEVIDVKASRFISKYCANCRNTYVVDQSKTKNCPGCGKPYGNMVKLVCPSCACQIEVNNAETDICPICNTTINVKREIEKSKQVHANTISVIKYEGSNEAFIYKHPIEDFNLGSQLIVHESQEAIFFYNGEALRPFTAGRYTLSTENIPMLRNITDGTTTGASPFHAEVYFANLTDHVGLPWGTSERITFIEPRYNIPLELRSFGTIGIKVVDSLRLIKKLIGTTNSLNISEVFNERDDGTELPGYFRSPLLTEIKSYLPTVINQYGISVLNLDAHLKELSAGMLVQIRNLFEKYGLEITEFNINRISVPEDNPNFQRIKRLATESGLKGEELTLDAKIKGEKLSLDAQLADIEFNTIQAQGRVEAAKAMNSANVERIRAQGAADAKGATIRGSGFAEADVMQRKGITEKDYVDADVQKAYAESLGQMGSHVGTSGAVGGGSSIAGDMVGMAMGFKVADYALGKMNNMNMFNENTSPANNAAPGTWNCSCGKIGNTKNFCGGCGKPRFNNNTWTCSSCGCIGNTDAFCENCGKPKA